MLLFMLRRSALFRIVRGEGRLWGRGRRTHNAGVVGSSPTPAIEASAQVQVCLDLRAFFSRVASKGGRRCHH
jgi:hypothetical protein